MKRDKKMAQDKLTDALRDLQVGYLASLPGKVEDLRRMAGQLEGLDRSDPIAERVGADFGRALHRLSGSAGSYGFAEVSRIARGLEKLWRGESESLERGLLLDRMKREVAELAEHVAGVVAKGPVDLAVEGIGLPAADGGAENGP